jgi:hypothetical protein
MLIHTLLVAHIAVLGYWLGSEFVINQGFRYVCRASSLETAERERLLDHVMDVDQHVRYALALQFTLGFALAFLMRYLPGGSSAAVAFGIAGALWLALIETVHRLRKSAPGRTLASVDRWIRYLLMAALAAAAAGAWMDLIPMRGWLAAKLLCFAGVMACGVGIRLSLLPLFRAFDTLRSSGSTPALERRIRRHYVESTSILAGLWVFIAAMTFLSIWKP